MLSLSQEVRVIEYIRGVSMPKRPKDETIPYQIQRGIPVPKNTKKFRKGKWSWLINIGKNESFGFNKPEYYRVTSAMNYWGKKFGYEFETGRDPEEKYDFRAWRVK